ncbi:hypothetical protein H6P81_020649 [Aristolochia fimbriata]|uniref:Uncharacterized protein n=1 Tax=Aristolochia fimbriata TaxID=158543 RepID=A0AAV7DWV8_ARIFI|nr:hypothetical protein H6P81_020649 [Aristolochia fimbriata]
MPTIGSSLTNFQLGPLEMRPERLKKPFRKQSPSLNLISSIHTRIPAAASEGPRQTKSINQTNTSNNPPFLIVNKSQQPQLLLLIKEKTNTSNRTDSLKTGSPAAAKILGENRVSTPATKKSAGMTPLEMGSFTPLSTAPSISAVPGLSQGTALLGQAAPKKETRKCSILHKLGFLTSRLLAVKASLRQFVEHLCCSPRNELSAFVVVFGRETQ